MAERQHGMAKIHCPHDGSLSLVIQNKVHNHRMECPHGPCACMHPGCEFAASPAALIIHLIYTHSIYVNRFPCSKDYSFIQLMVPATGSPRQQIISFGRDGTVFALHIDSHGTNTVVSFVCIISVACIWPRCRVKMWANDPPMLGPLNITGEYLLDKVKAVLEPTSSPTPGTVVLEEVILFLSVPPRYLTGYEPSKQLFISFCINKQVSSP